MQFDSMKIILVFKESLLTSCPHRRTSTSSAIPEEEEVLQGSADRWLKFNDTLVEEFDLNDHTLESECFGGSLKNSNSESRE